MNYLYLTGAIVAEVFGTSFMKQSQGFTKLAPSVITAIAYAIGHLDLPCFGVVIGVPR